MTIEKSARQAVPERTDGRRGFADNKTTTAYPAHPKVGTRLWVDRKPWALPIQQALARRPQPVTW